MPARFGDSVCATIGGGPPLSRSHGASRLAMSDGPPGAVAQRRIGTSDVGLQAVEATQASHTPFKHGCSRLGGH